MTFTLEGHSYLVLSAVPVVDSDQPKKIWVFHNPRFQASSPGESDHALVFVANPNELTKHSKM